MKRLSKNKKAGRWIKMNFKQKQKHKKKIGIHKICIYALLIFFSIAWVLPTFLSIITSFKSMFEIYTEGMWHLPQRFTLEYFHRAWKGISPYYLNSILIGVPSTIFCILVSSLGAYSFARLKFFGNDLLFFLILGGMMIPAQIVLIPLYKLFGSLGLINSIGGVILIHTSFSIPFCTFVLTNFFRTILSELQDAAKIDGCSEFRIYSKIIMPLSRPALAVLAIFQFTWIWNDFLFALIFLQSERVKPVTLGLLTFAGQYYTEYNLQCAGGLLISLPPIIVFLLYQREFIRGITAGAVKG